MIHNIECEVANTDIDKVFELLLDTAEKDNSKQDEMPSHLIIISDMEFNQGVYSEQGTNFEGWKKAFKEKGYELPKIIFWNVAGNTMGVPITKQECADFSLLFYINTSKSQYFLHNCNLIVI